ncbi:hypothetical protein SCA6_015203 [Theobroma cacao]
MGSYDSKKTKNSSINQNITTDKYQKPYLKFTVSICEQKQAQLIVDSDLPFLSVRSHRVN